jgi:prepilin-type N-terminal cleavage/methylation domain-containing protein
MTLIELAVVLVILGITAGIAAFGGMRPIGPTDSAQARADSLRTASLATGQALVDTVDESPVLYLPDGRIIQREHR